MSFTNKDINIIIIHSELFFLGLFPQTLRVRHLSMFARHYAYYNAYNL